jgi:cytochrome c oxidase subunit 3
MTIFLGSWAMMFCALFFAYGMARARAVDWPPAGLPALPIALPALNTALLLGSSLSLAEALKRARRGQTRELARLVALTFGLGAAFLALQCVVWRGLWNGGLSMKTGGAYASVFYGLTVFHALHVVVGLLLLLWVFFRALGGRYEKNPTPVRLCAMFWHFVDVVWVLMFLSLYLL